MYMSTPAMCHKHFKRGLITKKKVFHFLNFTLFVDYFILNVLWLMYSQCYAICYHVNLLGTYLQNYIHGYINITNWILLHYKMCKRHGFGFQISSLRITAKCDNLPPILSPVCASWCVPANQLSDRRQSVAEFQPM